jgi:hypothetical protein
MLNYGIILQDLHCSVEEPHNFYAAPVPVKKMEAAQPHTLQYAWQYFQHKEELRSVFNELFFRHYKLYSESGPLVLCDVQVTIKSRDSTRLLLFGCVHKKKIWGRASGV